MSDYEIKNWIQGFKAMDLAHWLSVLIPVVIAAGGVYATTMHEFRTEIKNTQIKVERQDVLIERAAEDIRYVRERIDDLYKKRN